MQPVDVLRLTNARQRLALVNIFRDRAHLAVRPCGSDCGLSGLALGARRIQVRNAQAGIVPLDVHRWLGRPPTPSEHVLFHRDYMKLEGLGLAYRVNLAGGRRTTHMKLTALGERVAAELLAEEAVMERERAAERPARHDAQEGAEHAEADDLPEPVDLDSMDWSGLELLIAEPGGSTAPVPSTPVPAEKPIAEPLANMVPAGAESEKPTDPT